MATIQLPLINQEAFLIILKQKLNAGMIAAAKPILEQALKDMEMEMQKKLGSMVVGFIDSYMTVERDGMDLRIVIKHDK